MAPDSGGCYHRGKVSVAIPGISLLAAGHVMLISHSQSKNEDAVYLGKLCLGYGELN